MRFALVDQAKEEFPVHRLCDCQSARKRDPLSASKKDPSSCIRYGPNDVSWFG